MFYTEMESIFDHAMATGRFALASGEALGANQAKSVAAKVEGPSSTQVPAKKTHTNVGCSSKAT